MYSWSRPRLQLQPLIFARSKSTKSSKNWLSRQSSDPYVKQRSTGVLDGTIYRARSAFKLLELDKKYRILRPGQVVCDLGAAPGGWSQVAAKQLRIGSSEVKGRKDSVLIAVDLLSMDPITGVHSLQGNFTDPSVQKQVSDMIDKRGVDVILSDMCANVTGTVKDVESSLNLCDMAFGFASEHLKKDGGSKSGVLVIKYFDHPDLLDFMKQKLKPAFGNVRTLRLDASISESSEQYFLCTGFHGP